MHLVIPRGTHSREDVEAALPQGFAVTQWSPVTFVECSWGHGERCRGHKTAQDALYAAGIDSHIQQGPALVCEPCKQ